MLQTPDDLKTRTGQEAFNQNGLSQRTISQLKDKFPDLEVYTDVALDPYNSDGHDGIVRDDGVIMNDQTIEYLCRQAVSQVPLHLSCSLQTKHPIHMPGCRCLALSLLFHVTRHRNRHRLEQYFGSSLHADCVLKDSVGCERVGLSGPQPAYRYSAAQ